MSDLTKYIKTYTDLQALTITIMNFEKLYDVQFVTKSPVLIVERQCVTNFFLWSDGVYRQFINEETWNNFSKEAKLEWLESYPEETTDEFKELQPFT